MNNFLFKLVLLIYAVPGFSNQNHCSTKINGYKIIKDSVYSFLSGKESACFFAFYIPNPDPTSDAKGNGNLGDTIWYGYYKINQPNKIYEFPKPVDTNWASICSIDSVSFYDMNRDTIPDIAIIGSCNKQNLANYNFPLVFIRQGEKYVLDKESYNNLNGCIALSVADLRAYMADPEIYGPIFDTRYSINN